MMKKCNTCTSYGNDCAGCADYFANCAHYKNKTPHNFVFSNGPGWIGIDYISESLGRTILIRPDTDLGVIDCNNMMERISRMSEDERRALVMA